MAGRFEVVEGEEGFGVKAGYMVLLCSRDCEYLRKDERLLKGRCTDHMSCHPVCAIGNNLIVLAFVISMI